MRTNLSHSKIHPVYGTQIMHENEWGWGRLYYQLTLATSSTN